MVAVGFSLPMAMSGPGGQGKAPGGVAGFSGAGAGAGANQGGSSQPSSDEDEDDAGDDEDEDNDDQGDEEDDDATDQDDEDRDDERDDEKADDRDEENDDEADEQDEDQDAENDDDQDDTDEDRDEDDDGVDDQGEDRDEDQDAENDDDQDEENDDTSDDSDEGHDDEGDGQHGDEEQEEDEDDQGEENDDEADDQDDHGDDDQDEDPDDGGDGNAPPVAHFAFACAALVCTFDAANSTDPEGDLDDFAWDFGDGHHDEGIVVSHTFDASGLYHVTLTVYDGADNADSSTQAVLVGEDGLATNQPPTALFEYECSGGSCSFNASASLDADGEIGAYGWDFAGLGSSNDAVANFTFIENGTYLVTLEVTDDDGAVASTNASLIVRLGDSNEPPVASFTWICAEFRCRFDASASHDPDGTIQNVTWAFPGGTQAFGQVVVHGFAGNGTYLVELRVTDDENATASQGRLVRIPGPNVIVSIEIVGGNVTTSTGGAPIEFDVVGFDGDGNVIPLNASTDILFNLSNPDAGTFNGSILTPGSVPGSYLVNASLVLAPNVTAQIALVLTSPPPLVLGGGGGGGGGGPIQALAPPVPPAEPPVEAPPPPGPPAPPPASEPGIVAPNEGAATQGLGALGLAGLAFGFVAAASIAGLFLVSRGRPIPLRIHLPQPAYQAWVQATDADSGELLASGYASPASNASGRNTWAWDGNAHTENLVRLDVVYHGGDVPFALTPPPAPAGPPTPTPPTPLPEVPA